MVHSLVNNEMERTAEVADAI